MTAVRSVKATWLVFVIFFVISLLTNIMGPLIPEVIRSFHLSLAAAGLLPFTFFIAYGVLSIPAGLLIERTSEKPVMLGGLALMLAGAFAFAGHPSYATALSSFFFIGAGATVLQVVINPLLRVSGGEEHYAFNCALAQFIFGVGSFLSPHVYTYLVQRTAWTSIYGVFGCAATIVMFVTAAMRLPKVTRTDDEKAGSWETHRKLFGMRVVWLYFVTMFLYVGLEQGAANWISQFLFAYHGYDPQTAGANAVSWFWGTITLGCLAGLGLLKLFDSRYVLIGVSAAAAGTLTAALAGPRGVSIVAFAGLGLFVSLMWPITFSLAMNSLGHSHGAFAGILCSAIAGGAVFPLLIGKLGDLLGLRTGLLLLYVSIAWILAVGFWARPLITNETLKSKKLTSAIAPGTS